MKKIAWIIIGTIAMITAVLFCEYIKTTGKTDVKFLIKGREVINIWEDQSTGKSYVFLPSYANLETTLIKVSAQAKVFIDGIQIKSGMNCSVFELNKEYGLSIKGIEKPLYFVRSDNVATMYINTVSGTMEDINKDKTRKEYIDITLYTVTGDLDYRSGSIDRIKGHGNSSWDWSAKKPYNIYLAIDKPLLHMPASEKWVLLANASDETKIRNKIVSDFAQLIQPKTGFAPDSEFVSLYLNGNYAGLYLLSEKVESIAERYMENQQNILFCLQNELSKINHSDKMLQLSNGLFTEISSPSLNTWEKKDKLSKGLAHFEIRLEGDGSLESIDINSWARKYLVEEVFGNLDADEASQYFYLDNSDNKLYAGPCWDYDQTINANSWFKIWWAANSIYAQKSWYKNLMARKVFYEKVTDIFEHEALPKMDWILNEDIPQWKSLLKKALTADFIRWSDLYKRDPVQSIEDFRSMLSDHVSFLNSIWLKKEKYCKVTFMVENRFISRYPLYIKCGSDGSEIPQPAEMGIQSKTGWYDQTGRQFDPGSMISEDIVLYDKIPVHQEEEKVSKLVFKKISMINIKDIDFKTVVLILLGVAGVLMILIDRQKTRRKNRG